MKITKYQYSFSTNLVKISEYIKQELSWMGRYIISYLSINLGLFSH